MSKTMPELASVAAAHAAHAETGKALVAAMERAYPVGTSVSIPRGRGQVRGVVVGHCSWWSDPTALLVKVDSSGRTMRCDVGHLIPDPSSTSWKQIRAAIEEALGGPLA